MAIRTTEHIDEVPGAALGPLEPILEELQGDYNALVSLFQTVDTLAVAGWCELDKARPNEKVLRECFAKIHKSMKAIYHIAGVKGDL